MKRSKNKFVLKNYDTGEVQDKTFSNIDKAFEARDRLNKKTGLDWTVVAVTPFGNDPVFNGEQWKWR